jgi:hypothetical protein
MFVEDAFDHPTLLHPFETISDLIFARHEQRPAPLKRDADLCRREVTPPAVNDPAHRAGHATPFKDEVGDGREATLFSSVPFAHVWLMVTF